MLLATSTEDNAVNVSVVKRKHLITIISVVNYVSCVLVKVSLSVFVPFVVCAAERFSLAFSLSFALKR